MHALGFYYVHAHWGHFCGLHLIVYTGDNNFLWSDIAYFFRSVLLCIIVKFSKFCKSEIIDTCGILMVLELFKLD